MKKKFILLVTVFIFDFVQAHSPLRKEDANKMVAAYFNKIYGNENRTFLPQDINRKYQIMDIVSDRLLDNGIEDGKIYFCSILGDDSCGIYLVIEQEIPRLLKISSILEYKKILDFMYRNDYPLEALNKVFRFIIDNSEYEQSITVH